MNIPVCYVIFATLHPIYLYILNLISEMLSTLKCKELNFGDVIKPKPRCSPVLIYHNNHIYSFGGVEMAGGRDVGAESFQQEVDQLRVAHQDTRIFEVRDT